MGCIEERDSIAERIRVCTGSRSVRLQLMVETEPLFRRLLEIALDKVERANAASCDEIGGKGTIGVLVGHDWRPTCVL